MNAKEARELSKRKINNDIIEYDDSLQNVMGSINLLASNGINCFFPKKLSKETEYELKTLGYRVSRLFGIIKIKW